MTTKELWQLVALGFTSKQIREAETRHANPDRLYLSTWDVRLLRRYAVRVDQGDVLPHRARRRARAVA